MPSEEKEKNEAWFAPAAPRILQQAELLLGHPLGVPFQRSRFTVGKGLNYSVSLVAVRFDEEPGMKPWAPSDLEADAMGREGTTPLVLPRTYGKATWVQL